MTLAALRWIFGVDRTEEAPCPLVLRDGDGWTPYQMTERREGRAVWGGSAIHQDREQFSFDVPAQLLGHLKGKHHAE